MRENSPFQEGIISETIQRLDKSFFQNPKELKDLIDRGNLMQKFLPKQTDIEKILQIIQRKVSRVLIYQWMSKKFKWDIYTALTLQTYINICSKLTIKKLEALSEKICIIKSFIVQNLSRERDSSSGNTRKHVHHKSLFAGHQGVIKT